MASNKEELSNREIEILCLVATGASNKEIARRLYISTNTVKVHIRNIFTKINVNSRTEAALYAINAHLVDPPQVTENSLRIAKENDRVARVPIRVSFFSSLYVIGVFIFMIIIALAAFWVWQTRKGINVSENSISQVNADRWTFLAPMPTARFGLAAVSYEQYIYTIAGKTSQGVTETVEQYYPLEDKWKMLAKKPTPVYEVGAAVLGGKIYVPGGRMESGGVTNVLEIYDPSQDIWSSGSQLPIGLSAYAIAAFEGKLYIFGGWDGNRFVSNVWMFDPYTEMWEKKSPLPSPRGYAGATTIGGKIYILGGFDGHKTFDSNLIYSPNLDHEGAIPWEDGQPMPNGRYAMGVSSVADMVEIAGGYQNDSESPTSLVYFPMSNSWQEFRASVDVSPIFSGSVTLGNFFYLLGGNLNNQPTDQNLAYQTIYTVSFPIIR